MYIYFVHAMNVYIIDIEKMANIIHICNNKKNGKYCTNFANVYKICQFLCVYNINLHCKYNVYIEISWKYHDACVNFLWVKIK